MQKSCWPTTFLLGQKVCLKAKEEPGQTLKIGLKSYLFSGVCDEVCYLPVLRCSDEEERQDQNGCTAMALQGLWWLEDAPVNNDAKQLDAFLDWLFSSEKQMDMPGQGRTFRRMASKFWKLWPLPRFIDEIHRVIFVDGIYIARNLVILIACSEEHVLSWHLARSENSASWSALLSRIAPPEMVVSDGGSGFAKAVKSVWPSVKVQRCTFHAFCQVKRYTTSRPNLQAGKELYALAKELLHIKTLRNAEWWVERFMQWCEFWADFLDEKSYVDGKKVYTHERLRKARRSLVSLVNNGTLFTFLDPELTVEESLPSTNNQIEGAVNSPLRDLLRRHRGMSTMRRVKAVFWWCYMHTECPASASQILKEMPSDDDVELLHEAFGSPIKDEGGPMEWGQGIVWSEFHSTTPYPNRMY